MIHFIRNWVSSATELLPNPQWSAQVWCHPTPDCGIHRIPWQAEGLVSDSKNLTMNYLVHTFVPLQKLGSVLESCPSAQYPAIIVPSNLFLSLEKSRTFDHVNHSSLSYAAFEPVILQVDNPWLSSIFRTFWMFETMANKLDKSKSMQSQDPCRIFRSCPKSVGNWSWQDFHDMPNLNWSSYLCRSWMKAESKVQRVVAKQSFEIPAATAGDSAYAEIARCSDTIA